MRFFAFLMIVCSFDCPEFQKTARCTTANFSFGVAKSKIQNRHRRKVSNTFLGFLLQMLGEILFDYFEHPAIFLTNTSIYPRSVRF